jgi:hypothetical protein
MPLTIDDVRRGVGQALSDGQFFAHLDLDLHWSHQPREVLAWEIFRGRLLDPAHTRRQQGFESWCLHEISGGCLLSVKRAADENCLYVTRGILSYAWEGYNAGGNVIESREIRKWISELVGTIRLAEIDSLEALRQDLSWLIFRAVVGLSRLPLTSVEAPLPLFSLGHFGYFPRDNSGGETVSSVALMVQRCLQAQQPQAVKAKLLESVLRASPADGIGEASRMFVERWTVIGHSARELPALFRLLFNEVALSPYTNFVANSLACLRYMAAAGNLHLEEHIDLLGHLVRQTCRHLTAYDLVTFHHRGANYPDALFLDSVLRDYIDLACRHPAMMTADDRFGRSRRRALRQGWLMRRLCEGLPIPDVPTSQGENTRVLPDPFERVPEEQIVSPGRRTKRLFADAPLPRLEGSLSDILKQGLADLRHPDEARELGTGLFLDRPMGCFKAPGETDTTLLSSYEAFSRSIMQQRLRVLQREFPGDVPGADCLPDPIGRRSAIPLVHSGRPQRPGAVSLDDCFRVADDFVLLRSTASSVRAFLEAFDFVPLSRQCAIDFLHPDQRPIIVSADNVRPGGRGVLLVFDRNGEIKLELAMNMTGGYRTYLDIEYPANGLVETHTGVSLLAGRQGTSADAARERATGTGGYLQ